MGVFDNFPYTNYHDLNLDWLIKQMQKLQQDVADYAGMALANPITYASPIQWDIMTAYDKNVIVLDSNDSAYMSTRDVPAGITITNTSYWLPIGDFPQLLEKALNMIAKNEESSPVSTIAYAKDDYLIWNEELFQALIAIPINTAFVINTNVKKVVLADIIKPLQSSLNTVINDITTLQNDVSANTGDILTLQNQVSANTQLRAKNHFRYYVDGVNGSDDNDGLTSGTAFKTVDKYLGMSSKYTELRCYVISAGTYYVHYNNISGVSVHITATVSGVNLHFYGDSTDQVSVYGGHWKIEGVDTNNKIGVGVSGSNRLLYFDNCFLSAHYVNFACPVEINGGAAAILSCNAWQIIGADSFIHLAAIKIVNTDNSKDGYSFTNCHVFFRGTFENSDLSETGTTNSFIYLFGSYVDIGSVVLQSTTHQYAYGIKCVASTLLITDTRYSGIANNSVNGNIITSGYKLSAYDG